MTQETTDFIHRIFYYFASISTITAGLIFLAKMCINYFISKGVEKYKTELNKEVEVFKSELKIKEAQSQIKFTRLHEERALSIKELYEHSLNLQNAIFNLTQPSQGPEWKGKELNNLVYSKLKKFQGHFVLCKILIQKDLCEKIEEF